MPKKTLTDLRKSLYKSVDNVINSGTPIIIDRKGHKVKLSLVTHTSKLSRLKPHKTIIGDKDELISLNPGKWKLPKTL